MRQVIREAAIGAAYFAARKMTLGAASIFSGFEKEMLRKPWLIPLIILGSMAAPRLARNAFGPTALDPVDSDQGIPFSPVKQAGIMSNPLYRFGIGIPAAYMLAGHNEAKSYMGKEPGVFGRLSRDHPAAIAMLFGLFGGTAARRISSSIGNLTKKTGMQSLSPEKSAAEFLSSAPELFKFSPVDVDSVIVEAILSKS